ncbi:MAG TPA: sugar kinase [Phycisphaerales bacterium]|nr:sugar kinase [Phycisphaerales bacterium]HCD33942.1 sugar kinase [Phycisphaerales bacterium]|tara:strand:- start:872 stop:1810 length:939 start_codon:yes stop_codon:yes gene_type:complete
MKRLTENKIILVVRQTRLDELIARFNTEDQARFYVEHLGADFSDYLLEDRTYKAAISQTEMILAEYGRVQMLDRQFVPNFIFGPNDTVLALGQDGLVANVLKYLNGQYLIGVNPDPQRWEGVLLPFGVSDLKLLIPEVFAKHRNVKTITMAQVQLNTGEKLYGVNDLFLGPRTHTSGRYAIHTGKKQENHSSSGVVVSTGLGSTGWLRSILAGSMGIVSSIDGRSGKIKKNQNFAWDADHLCFSVREPWPSRSSKANITFGKVTANNPLILISQMPENGVIFSDGIESDFLLFNAGTQATITIADKQGYLIT